MVDRSEDGFILAIDQGTTGTRVMIFDGDGAVRSRAYTEFEQHFPRPGWVEHDAGEIWDTVVRLIPQALASAAVSPDQIRAVGITNQRETVVCWDKASGRPLAPAIVWQDRRTAEACEELRSRGLEDLFRQRTGLLLDPYFSGTKIRWLLDEIGGLRERAGRGEVAFGTIDSWLVWNLTGGREHVTDVSNASRTLLFDLRRLAWDEEILDLLDIPIESLPRVVSSSGECGRVSGDLLGGHRAPVAGVAGDQQAALFGQACFDPGQAKCTYGTGAFVLLNTGEEAVASDERLLTTVAWRIGDRPAVYALEGSVFIAGAGIQWLRDGLGLIDDAAETEELARSLPSNEGVFFVPALVGLGAPYWDPHARGTFLGLTRGTSRAHLVRATLEGIAQQVADVTRAMESDAGFSLSEMRADGGASANAFLMQFQSDLLNTPLAVSAIAETTALGAAGLAGLAVGFWQDSADLASRWRSSLAYAPEMTPEERGELRARWRRAIERARGWAGPT